MKNQKSIRTITGVLKEKFERAQVDSPLLSAQLIIAKLLDIERARLILHYEELFPQELNPQLDKLALRREKGEPMAYILGEREFFSLDFIVNPHVLIPRPETELCIETALKYFQPEQAINFVDLGTGSGAIAVTLAKQLPNACGTALDISENALKTACKNADRHKQKLNFIQADFKNIPLAPNTQDLIISNPPYISENEYKNLSSEIKNFEPRLALVPDKNAVGTEPYAQIIPQAQKILKTRGTLIFELADHQAQEISELCKIFFPYTKIISDFNSQQRLVVAGNDKLL